MMKIYPFVRCARRNRTSNAQQDDECVDIDMPNAQSQGPIAASNMTRNIYYEEVNPHDDAIESTNMTENPYYE